jgi:hypothetical protein
MSSAIKQAPPRPHTFAHRLPRWTRRGAMLNKLARIDAVRRTAQAAASVLRGAFSRREIVDCEASASPLSGQRPTASFTKGSWRSRSRSLASS